MIALPEIDRTAENSAVDSRSSIVFFLLVFLVGASAALLVVDRQRPLQAAKHAEPFQRLVGGLGFGPALDLSGCIFTFDARLDGGCGQKCGPLPGGDCFCPRHTTSILFYLPLPSDAPRFDETNAHALPR